MLPDGLQRLGRIMGRDFLDDALELDGARDGMRVSGFAGLPTLHRPDASQQFLFVNGRPVRDRLLLGAVRAAYGDLVPRGRHPLLALFIDLDAREVDVNVHPAKAEVRFRDAGLVRSLLIGGLRARAGARRTSRQLRKAACARSRRWREARQAYDPSPSLADAAARQRHFHRGFAELLQAPLDGLDQPSADTAGAAEPVAEDHLDRPLGAARTQLHETYIVAETRTSVVIVDQHAAHERLVYERMKAMLENGGVARQGLLIPEIVELDDDEIAALTEAMPDLARLGLDHRAVRHRRRRRTRGARPSRRYRCRGLVQDLARSLVTDGGATC